MNDRNIAALDPAALSRRREGFAAAGPLLRALMVARVYARDDPLFEEFQKAVLREQAEAKRRK